MGQVSRQINGLIDLSDDPPTEGVGPRAKTEDGKVRHLENVLSIAAVAGKQHASTAMGIGKLATHLPEVCGLHITSTIKAEHGPVLECIDGCHHAFLRMSPLSLPLLVEGPLLLRCASDLHLRVQFDGKATTANLHPWPERGKLPRKDCFTPTEFIRATGAPPSIPPPATPSLPLRAA